MHRIGSNKNSLRRDKSNLKKAMNSTENKMSSKRDEYNSHQPKATSLGRTSTLKRLTSKGSLCGVKSINNAEKSRNEQSRTSLSSSKNSSNKAQRRTKKVETKLYRRDKAVNQKVTKDRGVVYKNVENKECYKKSMAVPNIVYSCNKHKAAMEDYKRIIAGIKCKANIVEECIRLQSEDLGNVNIENPEVKPKLIL